MLNDQLNLSVDALNDANPVAELYDRYEEQQNRSKYISGSHTPGSRDEIGFYRSFPTRSGNFKGVGKTSVKLTLDVSIPGVDSSTTMMAPVIVECSFSVPVGVQAEDIVHIRQRLIALLDNDSLMNSLNIQLMV